ncbi:MAG: ribose-phosphate pyrophosphokinase [Firmicutes bacterium]|nr:ribose-phosphate pyrophosphokinase [Bacillota bacterium]
MSMLEGMKIFVGTSVPQLGKEVAEFLQVPLGHVMIKRFACGEIYVRYEETVRGYDVFVIQSLSQPVNDNLVELMIMIDALKRASAGRINAVIPHYGYARQEKKVAPREPISARMVADVLTTVGADRVVTIDLHAPAIQGFFNIPVDHLTALPILADYFRGRDLSDAVVVALDAGGIKRAEQMAARLNLPLVGMYKRRPDHNVAEVTHVIGDVVGKKPIIIEDLIDTGGTLIAGVEALLQHGAKPEVYVCATHPILSGPAAERMAHPAIKEVVFTNTVAIPPNRKLPKVTVLSVAPLVAKAIHRIHTEGSVSELFD